jgi:hypothetical protein
MLILPICINIRVFQLSQGVILEIIRNNLTKNTKQETTSQELNMYAMMSFKRAQEVATTSDKMQHRRQMELDKLLRRPGKFNLL